MSEAAHAFLHIPLADGGFLSAHLWRPANGPPVPAILEFRPYRGYDLFRPLEERYLAAWASHGYAVLAIDIAGSGQSNGLLHDEYLPREIDDAIAAIGWCAEQPWCDGQVGLSGMSWAAFTALRVSARRPPALKAMVLGGVSEDGWRTDIHGLGGVPYVAEVDWAGVMLLLNALPPDPADFGENWKAAWRERLAASRPWIEPWLAHRSRDAYWVDKAFDLEGSDQPDLPLLLYAGWADKYATSALRIAEAWRGPVRTLIGPWEHSVPDMARRKPRIDFLGEALRWWDHWLKGAPTGVLEDAPLRTWIDEPDRQGRTGAGRWVSAAWPGADGQALTLALTGPGQLGAPAASQAGTTIRLAPSPRMPEALHVDRYEDEPGLFDPASIEGGMIALTAPMGADVDVCGVPRLRCRAWTDRPGGQIVARLLDIDPEGAAVRMTTGALNLAFRDRVDQPAAPTPSEPMDLAIPFQATAWRLKRGHRLALALSAEGWPTLWPDRRGAEITIAADSLVLDLPLLDEIAPAPVFAEPSRLASTEVAALKWIDADAEALLSTGLSHAAVYDNRSAAHHLPATGTDYFSASRFAVALRDEGREAVAVRVSRAVFRRPDWDVRVETRLEVTSKPEVFAIAWTVRAEHDGAVIYDHSETAEVSRGAG